ncbi:AMP-dependent synthetase/ligase [Gephyromycinifex aptenodytis]|uniref:AMP-dependent synthetase/ligase n=1 Tax=Gephyromycinifex aptenodytis TaxID=2716227 RepID=UPI001447950A|nr:long-chain fatty acid--CoA ligase [Gephyromycinifex aptenodytis]
MVLENAQTEPYDRARLEARPQSVAHLLRERFAATPDGGAYQYFDHDDLISLTWSEFADQMRPWAAGLAALGVEIGDRVAIISTSRYEWVVANWAIQYCGAATTTVYPSSQAADVAFILSDSGSRVVFAEDAAQVAKLESRRGALADVAKVVVIDSAGVELGDWVIDLSQLVELGREALEKDPGLLEARVDALTPDHLATIIYTSGTTGTPKGAEITHSALVYEGAAIASIGMLTEEDLQFLWLPLAHVFGNVLLILGLTNGFPTCVDGRIDRIVENMERVKPTFMGAAPRIFEKAYAKINAVLHEGSPVKAKLADWAVGVGLQVAAAAERGEACSPVLTAQYAVADKLVLSKIRARFGGRIRFMISGSARLDPSLSRWFAAAGMLICEGYGLTETSAATCVNRPWRGAHQHGTIGWPFPGTSVRIAEDGELLVKGPGVMRGYHNQPEATKEAFTADGFFCTGDIGEIDSRGFVRITDRKKDLFKTSGGKYIAPALIETRFKAICPYVGQFIVLGSERNFAAALITLDPEPITAWAKTQGMESASYEEIVTSQEARDLIAGYVDELNSGLNRWETIKRFTILPRDLTIDDGDLTPSLKLRRRVVAEKFSDEIAELYSGEGQA